MSLNYLCSGRRHLAGRMAESPAVATGEHPSDGEGEGLRRSHLDPDPFRQFEAWFAAARDADVAQPEAMALATASPDGRPSVRMVLLKGAGPEGFVFYTNAESRKGREIDANPKAAIALYWQPLHRQVRAAGRVEPLTAGESDAYFASRPRGAQLAASSSSQSRPIPDRNTLMAEYERLERELDGRPVPRPPHWGGFRLIPEEIEFWQNRPSRLHDRFLYTRDAREPSGWRIERLAP
jgi:pyridoxamine 5'-phosphate oxidase